MYILKSLILWFLLLISAILNAGLREKFITPSTGEQVSHAISSVTGSIFIFLITLLFIGMLGLTGARQSWWVGIFWVCLTVAFEFLFGHYVMKHSWTHLLDDYNVFKGRLWVLVLVVTVISPWVAGRMRGLW